MPVFDVDALLAEVSPEQPCGPDLEYDEAFSEMERASQGKPEQQYGDTVIDAEEPDWAEVKARSIDVLNRSRDLRAAVHLAKATLMEDGLVGFRDALAIIRGYMERYWPSLHPQLDPDDDNDPTIRANTLNGLCHYAVIESLRTTPLLNSRSLRVSFRDIALAKGEITLPEGSGESILGMAAVNSIFSEVEAEALHEVATAVSESLEHAKAIEAAMTEQVGAYDTCNLDPLTKELTSINKFLQEKVGTRTPAEPAVETQSESSAVASDQPASGSDPSGRVAAARFNGEINSREDAIRAIDRVCQYFERHEPSSPLPLLLRRAKRLSKKSFLEILKDISPEIVSQAEALGGQDAGDIDDYSDVDDTPPKVEVSAPQTSPSPPVQVDDGY